MYRLIAEHKDGRYISKIECDVASAFRATVELRSKGFVVSVQSETFNKKLNKKL